MSRRQLRLEILPDPERLAERAAAEVLAALESALATRGRASWVLAGGSTPRRLYELLAARPGALDWRRIELFWSDERCLPPAAAASNYRLVAETLLARIGLRRESVHRIRAERSPEEAARRYGEEVAAALARGPFDLVLLGLGVDGHVASLFSQAVPAGAGLAAAVRAPVEPRWRVTLTPPALTRSRRTLFMVSGAAKATAVRAALARDARGLPSALVRPRSGETVWLLDRAAAARLPDGALW